MIRPLDKLVGRTLVILVAITACLLSRNPALAESPLTCGPTESIDKYRLLRQLSLDLRGTIPSIEEYQALDERDDVGEEALTEILTSEPYFAQVREYHRSLIWAGLEAGSSIVPSRRRLTSPGARPLRIKQLRRAYRGRVDVECVNQLQTEFDAEGHPLPIQTFEDPSCRRGTCIQEGFVRVSPYWAPETSVKVCAFDAQEFEVGLDGERCGSFSVDSGCGCGPELQHCLPRANSPIHDLVRDALAEESTRIFESVVRSGASYLESFTTRTTHVNGPLAHFYRYLSNDVPLELSNGRGYDSQVSNVPDLDFDDQNWVPVERNAPHSGILTTPGFHLRFTSNRGRTNRFYSVFRCEPFISTEGLPPEEDELPNPNLRERAGCDVCHETLEQGAAHWGRWRTDGEFGFFDEASVDFGTKRSECANCSGRDCSAFCDAYFVTANTATHPDELAEWNGYPRAREWLSEAESQAIETGPSGLLAEQQDRDKVASCTVRNLAEHLLNRELTEEELLGWLPKLHSDFAASNYNFTTLVRNLVSDRRYRTIR